MPKEIDKVILVKAKGRPTVEIIFGQAHLGNYRIYLWDASGKNPALLAHGNNIDDEEDTFSIPHDPEDLDQRILSFEVLVQAAEPKDGQFYNLTIAVRQQGETCPGGLILQTGTFRDVKSLIGFRRFIL